MLNALSAITVGLFFVAALLGLATGSFVTCWAWRLTHEESIRTGQSHCIFCNHSLELRDLVPVVSWLVLHGRCRYCGQKIPLRYCVAELGCAAMFIGIAARYGFSLETVELFFFGAILLFLSLTDIEAFLIPNGCIVVALVVRVLYWAIEFIRGNVIISDVLFYLGSAFGVGVALLVVVLVADKLLGRSSMGGGDLKLYFISMLYFGWQQGLFLIFVSCIFGIALSFVGLSVSYDKREQPCFADRAHTLEISLNRVIPFGPSIALACIVTMLFGEPFIAWYTVLF